jgi:hypothetical protein
LEESGTGSGSYPVAGCGISGVETVLVIIFTAKNEMHIKFQLINL